MNEADPVPLSALQHWAYCPRFRTLGGTPVFRVYHDRAHFTDYEIRHDDLSVTINPDALAAFYKVGELDVLDHSPEVLGLKSIERR